MSSKLQFYYNYLCPYCRPVGFLLKETNVDHNANHLDLFKGEHKTEEYKKINPFQRVPAIIESDFVLFESTTLLKYVANSRNLDDHWYPKDPKHRAYVDLYFDWQIANLANMQKFNLFKLGYIKDLTEEQCLATTQTGLKSLEDVFLSQRKFLSGMDDISIADVALIYHLAATKDLGVELSKRAEEYHNDVLNASKGLKEDVEEYLAKKRERFHSK